MKNKIPTSAIILFNLVIASLIIFSIYQEFQKTSLEKNNLKSEYIDFEKLCEKDGLYYKKSNNASLIDECVSKRSFITKKILDYNKLNLNHSSLLAELERYI